MDDDNNSSSVKVTADATDATVGKAVYEVKIDTKQDKTYSYKISAYDWSIINKKVK